MTISINVPVSVFAAIPLWRPSLIPRRNKLRGQDKQRQMSSDAVDDVGFGCQGHQRFAYEGCVCSCLLVS